MAELGSVLAQIAFPLHASVLPRYVRNLRREEKCIFQSKLNRHISSHSKKFCTGDAKMWRFPGRMWQKTSQVSKKNFVCESVTFFQKCDKCDASHSLSTKKLTNLTSLTFLEFFLKCINIDCICWDHYDHMHFLFLFTLFILCVFVFNKYHFSFVYCCCVILCICIHIYVYTFIDYLLMCCIVFWFLFNLDYLVFDYCHVYFIIFIVLVSSMSDPPGPRRQHWRHFRASSTSTEGKQGEKEGEGATHERFGCWKKRIPDTRYN